MTHTLQNVAARPGASLTFRRAVAMSAALGALLTFNTAGQAASKLVHPPFQEFIAASSIRPVVETAVLVSGIRTGEERAVKAGQVLTKLRVYTMDETPQLEVIRDVLVKTDGGKLDLAAGAQVSPYARLIAEDGAHYYLISMDHSGLSFLSGRRFVAVSERGAVVDRSLVASGGGFALASPVEMDKGEMVITKSRREGSTLCSITTTYLGSFGGVSSFRVGVTNARETARYSRDLAYADELTAITIGGISWWRDSARNRVWKARATVSPEQACARGL